MARTVQRIAGRYELHEVIGRGGMGVVYRAHDAVLDRIVAVKVLPAEYASDVTLVERFTREARAAARLADPNIVAVFDTGTDGEVRYIVMELVPGLSLAQLLRERGALAVPEAVEIAAQVATALSAAHAAGIIHRDIKPANVMMQPSGDVKVLDFVIAHARADEALTRTTAVLGSAPYMPPEMAEGQPADERSDIYSLGCVLYEMLTGRPPFSPRSLRRSCISTSAPLHGRQASSSRGFQTPSTAWSCGCSPSDRPIGRSRRRSLRARCGPRWSSGAPRCRRNRRRGPRRRWRRPAQPSGRGTGLPSTRGSRSLRRRRRCLRCC